MKLAAILRKKSWDTVLVKEDFSVSDVFVFFYPSPHFNVVAAAKSIEQSNILNIEKGEGGFDGIQFIENEGKSIDYRKKLCVSTILHGIVQELRTSTRQEPWVDKV